MDGEQRRIDEMWNTWNAMTDSERYAWKRAMAEMEAERSEIQKRDIARVLGVGSAADGQYMNDVWNDFLKARRQALQSMLDFVHAAQKAFESHAWIVQGYDAGMKGWIAYCKDNFGQQAAIMRQLPKSDRKQLLLEAKSTGLSDRKVAQIFDVSASTVRRATVDDGQQPGEDQ